MRDPAKITTVCNHTSQLGEGPVWDAKRQLLYWIDILPGEIHTWSPREGTLPTISVHQMLGAIAVCRNGDFIGAMKNGIGFIDRQTGAVNWIADPEAGITGNRFNDGKCDPMGRFWAGTLSLSDEAGKAGLYMMNTDLSVSRRLTGLGLSNGLAWSADERVFYHVDTTAREIASYKYDKTTGDIEGKKIIIRFGEEDGFPDGMTIDTDDKLWVAHFGGARISRWDPATAQLLDTIHLPVTNVTSVTFGGADLTDIYITTAKHGLDEAALAREPLAGSVFVVRNSGYKGRAAVEFGY